MAPERVDRKMSIFKGDLRDVFCKKTIITNAKDGPERVSSFLAFQKPSILTQINKKQILLTCLHSKEPYQTLVYVIALIENLNIKPSLFNDLDLLI